MEIPLFVLIPLGIILVLALLGLAFFAFLFHSLVEGLSKAFWR